MSVLTEAQQPAVVHQFSIQQAVDYATKNNVQVKNALLDVQIQQQTNREITSAALPQVTGNTSLTNYPKIPTTLLPGEIVGQPAGTFVPVQFGTKYNANAGVEFDQLLFDGQVFVGLQARNTSIEWRQKSVELTEEIIKANIYKIYYQLVVSKTQIELLDANIARLKKLLSDTREIYKNGFAEKLDVDKVSVQLANLQTEKVKALNAISNGYLGLKLLMGMPMKDSLVLTDTLNYTQIKEGMLENNYSYSDRKEYQYAELGRKLNEYNIRRFKLSKIPTVSLNGAYTKNAQRNKFDFLKGGPWYSTAYFTMRVSVPIFNGFSTRAKIRRSELELLQTENQIETLKLSIDNETETARTNFNSAIITLDFQKQNMELAEQVYNQTKKKYEAGLGSNLEITGAQTELKTAQTNYITALYDAIIARVDFLKATGKL